MRHHSTAIKDLEDDQTLKELFGGELPEIIMLEPEVPTLSRESARMALEREGYVVVESTEVQGQA
jgi:hypothetical protein